MKIPWNSIVSTYQSPITISYDSWMLSLLLDQTFAVCEHAYSLAQNLDPNSEGRGVLQFKTGLMSVIKVIFNSMAWLIIFCIFRHSLGAFCSNLYALDAQSLDT